MKNKNVYYLLISISILAILIRTFFKIGPNIELVTSTALLSGYLLPKSKLAYVFPLIVMLCSDLILGNNQIFVFTWTGFILPVLFSQKILTKINLSKNRILNQILLASSGSVISVLFFYLWTNLGVVLVSGMYELSFNGLLSSYINALPFLKLQLAANLIIAPLTFLAKEFLLFGKINAKLDQYSR